MSNIPDGVETQTGEGRDLKSAIEAAAEALGIPTNRVAYKLDLSHFRGSGGGSVPRETVKIIAWEGEEREEAPPAPKRERRERRERRDDRPREDRGDSRELRGAEEGTTEASEFAQQWFQTLLDLMGVEGEVKATGSDERVHLFVTAERAGRVIGKRGSTLGAIRHMLRLSLESFGDLVIDVDVADNRDGERKKDRKRGRDRDRDRGDRGDRGGRDRDRKRGRGRGRDRDRDRDRDRGRGRGRSREKGRFPEEKLRTLARKAAGKAKETGRTITINLELNSYDRRIIHMEVAELDGVNTQSQVKDGTKYVQVIPED